jgi:DNA primase
MDDIKRILSMKQVAEHYGYKANRAGFITCPFHKEKTSSLKIYDNDRGWHCFGCNEGGSVIDFAMKLYNLNYSQAVTRLNYDFRLGLTYQKPDMRAEIELKKRKAFEEKQKELIRLIYQWHLLEFKKQRKIVQIYKPEPHEEVIQEFADAIIAMNNEESWLLCHEGW